MDRLIHVRHLVESHTYFCHLDFLRPVATGGALAGGAAVTGAGGAVATGGANNVVDAGAGSSNVVDAGAGSSNVVDAGALVIAGATAVIVCSAATEALGWGAVPRPSLPRTKARVDGVAATTPMTARRTTGTRYQIFDRFFFGATA